MREKDTPLKLVRMWPKLRRGCYEQLDYLQGAKTDKEAWWPDYCMLPISAAFTYLAESGYNDVQAASNAAELTACWMWRKNKIVYKFDKDLMESLREQAEDISETETIPTELLLHLPYPCIYFKCNGLLEHVDGFFAWIEWDINRKAPELRVQIVTDDFGRSLPMVMHLIPNGTIGACIDDTLKTTEEVSGSEYSRDKVGFTTILTAVQMILYISADNADMMEEPSAVRPVITTQKVVNLIQDKASEVKAMDVGVRVGAALRKARVQYEKTGETGAGSRKRAHARRGHWHHYWTGPKEGDRKLILKWTAPTVIHPEEGLDNCVVVFPVK